jgi:hypothetical protein
MNETPPRLDRTKEVIVAMLRENTGRKLTDSGDYYGRNYDANKNRNFEAEKAGHFDIHVRDNEDIEVMYVFSLYHWLMSRLQYDEEMDAILQGYLKANEGSTVLRLVADFPLHLREKDRHVTDSHGQEVEGFPVTYTYNYENLLDQNCQFVLFEVDDVPYVTLQVHGGCDASMGMTMPRAFRVTGIDGDDAWLMFEYATAVLIADRPENDKTTPFEQIGWRTENSGEKWYEDDVGCTVKQKNLEEYPFTTIRAKKGKGYVFVDEENKKIYCPVTGWELRLEYK